RPPAAGRPAARPQAPDRRPAARAPPTLPPRPLDGGLACLAGAPGPAARAGPLGDAATPASPGVADAGDPPRRAPPRPGDQRRRHRRLAAGHPRHRPGDGLDAACRGRSLRPPPQGQAAVALLRPDALQPLLGGSQADAGLIRAADPELRRVLIEAAWLLARLEPRWRQLADRLKAQGKPSTVAVAAVANRFVRWLHHEGVRRQAPALAPPTQTTPP